VITDELRLALLVERFGTVPDDEVHAQPRPLVPWTPDTPEWVAARRRALHAALSVPRQRGRQAT